MHRFSGSPGIRPGTPLRVRAAVEYKRDDFTIQTQRGSELSLHHAACNQSLYVGIVQTEHANESEVNFTEHRAARACLQAFTRSAA